MKTLRKLKKLDLHAETLRILDHPDLRDAAGGATRICTLNCSEICTDTHACSGCVPCA